MLSKEQILRSLNHKEEYERVKNSLGFEFLTACLDEKISQLRQKILAPPADLAEIISQQQAIGAVRELEEFKISLPCLVSQYQPS